MENIAVAQNLSNKEHPAKAFFARLWGDSFERAFICGKPQGGPWSDTPVSDPAKALAEINRRANGEIYMSCATFSLVGGRKAKYAIEARAFWFDIDCGAEKAAEGKGYLSKKLAAEALGAFCKALGIPEPTTNDSGNGLHIYWFLNEAVPAATWNSTANKLNALAHKRGLMVDYPCTADITRVLRVPGTFNHKDLANLKEVKIKRSSPPISAAFFISAIEKAYGETPTVPAIATTPDNIPAFMTGERGNLADLVTPETPDALQRMQDALSCISPDCDRDTWMRVVWSIQAHGWPSGIDIAQTWSAGSADKYNDADFRVLVESFDPTGGTGAGTLYHIAKQHGWLDPMTQQPLTTTPASLGSAHLPRLNSDDGRIQFSNEPPPQRDFTIGDIMLMAKACLLAGFGGVSKTQWLFHATVCIALGLPFMGKMTSAGAVLLLLGEEDLAEIARRFNAIAHMMKLTAGQRDLIQQRVRAFPMVGLDMRLTRIVGGSLEGSGFAAEILEAARQLEDACGLPVRLIGLDHAGLIHGGEFNAREDVVQTMRQVNHIAQESGAAVVVLAHSPKAAAGAEKSTASAVAGSTAWVDHARGALVLRTMNDDEGKRYGIPPDSRNTYVSLTVVKNNYGPTGGEFWLARESATAYGVGVLRHLQLQERASKSSASASCMAPGLQ